jgi:hypothetical protein
MRMGESIVGVPAKMTVPDGSVGPKEYDTGVPNLSVNPRPLGNVYPDGKEYIQLDAVMGIVDVNVIGVMGTPTVSV